jgi:CHAT domain-containing protein
LIYINKENSELTKEIKIFREPFRKIKQGSFLLEELKKFDLRLAHKLYNELFSPAMSYLKGIKQLVIIPHGCLNYLPFEMLVSRIDKKSIEEKVLFSEYATPQYLIEDYSISYAPSASVLDPKLLARDRKEPRDKKMFAIANPRFGTVLSKNPEDSKTHSFLTKSMLEKIGPLPHSEHEIEVIEKYFDETLICKNADATEENFIKQAPHFPIIHLSTHGFLNETNPSYSSLVFAYNEEIKDVDLLHAYEIFDLKINCDLVTLSACESGLGQQIEKVGGEGVVGLSRAFLYAGARSLVVSLWQVADESTSILMSEFYKNWREKGLSKIEALQQAKLSLMKKEKKIGNRLLSYSHPFFWAPFILIGESE